MKGLEQWGEGRVATGQEEEKEPTLQTLIDQLSTIILLLIIFIRLFSVCFIVLNLCDSIPSGGSSTNCEATETKMTLPFWPHGVSHPPHSSSRRFVFIYSLFRLISIFHDYLLPRPPPPLSPVVDAKNIWLFWETIEFGAILFFRENMVFGVRV